MITCTLGDKKYSVDFISGRALREIEPATKMYARIQHMAQAALEEADFTEADQVSVQDALDALVKWFCILFGNQFTPDEVYDGYPSDRLMVDIPIALMAVQTATTQVLSEFPMKPAATETGTMKTKESTTSP